MKVLHLIIDNYGFLEKMKVLYCYIDLHDEKNIHGEVQVYKLEI
jgi:hypothetical protein